MSFHITIPAPMPADGVRRLTPREVMQRAHAMACIRDKDQAQCQGQVYATLFFDGSRNNKDWVEPGLGGTQMAANKHSNVARLFNAAIDKPSEGFFSYYIPGVGTPYADIGDRGPIHGYAGQGFGYMGADRINWGITRVFNAVHAYLTGHVLLSDDLAKTVVNNASSSVGSLGFEGPYRRMGLSSWRDKLVPVIQESQRKVTQINVAVFGFSRGAAEARVFVNWLAELLEPAEDGYRLAGVPFRLYFMGLFDSVASVGVPDAIPGFDGHMDWAYGQMGIHPMVEQCVHFIALHEQRASFPLEMASNVRQVAYPGMHSDVGGGYRPGEQGHSMPSWGVSPQLSQIPLIDMHHAALKGGVPLRFNDDIAASPGLAKDFYCSPDLIQAFNNFYQDCGIGAASGKDAVLAAIQAHTRQYLKWRYQLIASMATARISTRRYYRDANALDRQQLAEGEEDFERSVQSIRLRLTRTRGSQADPFAAVPLVVMGRWFADDPYKPVNPDTMAMLKAIESEEPLPNAVTYLMDNYIHDSRCGFRVGGAMEPRALTGGYFRYRDVYQNDWPVSMADTSQSDVSKV